VVYYRDCPGNLQNTLQQNHLERQRLTQKASQTFFGNNLVQQNIDKQWFLNFQ